MGVMSRPNIRIASYNIRKARGLDQRRDPGRILDVINGLEADVVVLQEADRRLGQRPAALPRSMIERHSEFHVAPVAANDTSLGWHGNALLIRSGLRVSHIQRIDLPGFEPRGAVHAKIEGDAEFTVVATHLGLRRRDRRAQQAEICAALPKDCATIVAGDFNEWSSTSGLEGFAARFELCAPGRSFHARRPTAALDRFALSDQVRISDAGVEEGGLAKRASDHLPIWCDVDLPAARQADHSGAGHTQNAQVPVAGRGV